MAVSMTGYGKSVLENESVSIKVEIKSVNSRYLDINYKSSRGLSFMEEKIRNMVKAAITRGKVDIYIGMRGNAGISKSVSIDENLASTYKEALTKLKSKLGLRGKAALSDFTGVPGILSIEENDPEEDEISPLVVAAFNYALEKIVDMKSTEGRALEKDMLIKVNEMDEIVNGIEKSADGLTEAYRDKLNARVKELMNGADVDESKIAQEVAFF
ncbi:MAG: YicC/YloC family endoribonuclease, partial [Clostridia bacterium]|nr:YicC/YloC family endoribonuclease [Clostridia bacterium]